MPDQPLDLVFPTSGIDLKTEFELQPPGTTPVAINVRAVEPGTQRNRGGSRPGIRRYIDQQLGTVSHLIQHLNIIVDPTVGATGGQEESDTVAPTDDGGDGSGILDPSNNPDPAHPRNPGNRYIRRRGSGHMMKRSVGTPHTAAGPIALIQSNIQGYEFDTIERDPIFAVQPVLDHLLVCVIGYLVDPLDSDPGFTVRGAGVGENYTGPTGPLNEVAIGSTTVGVKVYYRIATGGAGEKTVKVTPAVGAEMVVSLLEYKNVAVGSPLDGTGGNANSVGFPTSWTVGNVQVDGENEVVIAAFVSALHDFTGDFTWGSGFSVVQSYENGAPDAVDTVLWVGQKLLLSADVTPTGTLAGGGEKSVGIGVSFKNG